MVQESKSFGWDDVEEECSPERELSPPMPTIPPPPPPADADEDVTSAWTTDIPDFATDQLANFDEEEEPYAIALFDYFTDHPDDLCFSVSAFETAENFTEP